MKFQNIISLSLGLLVCGAALSSCDDIPADDRLIEQPKLEIRRNVLIQEFTGQRCSNCPQGAAAVYAIQEANPDAVIAVCLHPERTSYTRPLGGLDLTCSVATAYYAYYQPAGFPSAIINGQNPPLTNTIMWSGNVSTELEKGTSVNIEVAPSFDASTRELSVDYTLDFSSQVDAELNLNVWIVENGIIGQQYQSSGAPIQNYVHNHVLRGSMTDNWGISLGNSFDLLTQPYGTLKMTLPDEWVAENCEIVAFIQHPDSKLIENVVEAKIIR